MSDRGEGESWREISVGRAKPKHRLGGRISKYGSTTLDIERRAVFLSPRSVSGLAGRPCGVLADLCALTPPAEVVETTTAAPPADRQCRLVCDGVDGTDREGCRE